MADKGVCKVSRQQRYRAVVGTQDGQFEGNVRVEWFEYEPGDR